MSAGGANAGAEVAFRTFQPLILAHFEDQPTLLLLVATSGARSGRAVRVEVLRTGTLGVILVLSGASQRKL